jgi:probable rRNA maturation factor
MRLDIRTSDPAWNAVPDLRKLARAAVKASLAHENVALSILFTDDAAMQALNLQWRGQDKPTNVLSFPASRTAAIPGEPSELGDIALGFGITAAEAQAQGKALHHHVAHLLVHGTLHLLGYDHETDDDAEAMEAREIRILGELGIGNPYAT